VEFFTTREVYAASEERSPVNFVVLDGAGGNAWERTVAEALETLPGVASYVKNDHLGFTIPYTHQGRPHQYQPDFLVRLDAPDDAPRNLIVEVSGGRKDQAARHAKAQAATSLWVPAVNNHGGFGRWGFIEIENPAHAKRDLAAAVEGLLRSERRVARAQRDTATSAVVRPAPAAPQRETG
jgi:type III restriction enzyme